MSDGLLFAGPLGRMRAEDVLQFVAQAGVRAHVAFTTEDRVHGWPRAVDLVIEDGRVIGLGPRGRGLRLGDLIVGRGTVPRSALEAALAGGDADAGGGRLGERLVATGVVTAETVEDLAWERHARVLWGLLTWDRGAFRVTALEPGDGAGATPLEPPLPIAALLLDGLQRAEAALFDAASLAAADLLAGEDFDPARL
ncbi:MAG: DUF4388 domain-containing protein [Candidatus Eisenbacteria bacterium]